ncbi:MAG: O-antigen ligase family protein [Granulosicoccus sp.]
MRVATYTEYSRPTQGSLSALIVLLLTILLGMGVVQTIAGYVGGIFPKLMTPMWLILYMSAFAGLMFSHGVNWISWLVRYRILLVILLLGTVASVSWSIDAQVSAERVVHLVGTSLIGIFIGFTIPLLITLRIFAVALALAVLVSVGAALVLPELGIEDYEGRQVWRGIFNSKNDLGFWAGAGVLLYVTLSESFHSPGVKLLCYVMAGVCLCVLALSQSATSLVAMLVAGALSLYLYIASRFQLGFIRMAFVAILFVALTGLAIANIETSELVGRSGDLTGRGEVWRQVLKLIVNYPLTGVGYGSLWFPTDDTIWIQQSFFDFTWIVYHAHNGLLQIASEVGMPLALIALLMVAQQLIEIFYCQYERQQVGVLFVLGFIVALLISNFSEARFLVTRELFWIFFIALPISMLRQINVVSEDIATPAQPDLSAAADVPGKPWLGPLPKELAQNQVVSKVGATVMLDLYQHDDTAAENDFDVKSSTLSLTETDIDLGEILDDSEHDMSFDAKDEDTDVFSELPEKMAPDTQPLELSDIVRPGTYDDDDTFDVDRYDIDLDSTSDWVDIDLYDDK